MKTFRQFISESNDQILYHITSASDVPSILKKGILPNKSKNGMTYNRWGKKISQKGYVYAMETFEDAARMAAKMLWQLNHESDLSAIKIIRFRDDLDLYVHDTHHEGSGGKGRWMMKQGSVAPDQILSVIDYKPEMGRRLVQTGGNPNDELKYEEFYESTTNDLDKQLRKFGLKRTNKFNRIGKEIGGNIYCHRLYEDQFPKELIDRAKEQLPDDFHYDVVKYDPAKLTFTFIISSDFDSNPEPSVNGGFLVYLEGKRMKQRFGDAGWIYHHKWMWVADDYNGFDVEESKRRSLQWVSIPGIDRSRIGQRKYWEANVIPLLDK